MPFAGRGSCISSGRPGRTTGASCCRSRRWCRFAILYDDITERRRTDAALRESEGRLRQFGEASQDILWIGDAETLQWTYLTPAFEAIYGLSRDKALSGDNDRSWTELIVPEDREPAMAAIERVRGVHASVMSQP